MMDFQDTLTIQSKEMEGVSFTIRTFSHGLRSRLRLALSPALDKIRNLTEQMDDIARPFEDEEPAQEESVIEVEAEDHNSIKAKAIAAMKAHERIQRLSLDVEMITAAEVDPEYLKAALVSVEGITYKGAPFGALSLYNYGPEALCQEIVYAIKQQASLAGQEKANLSLPTTSGAEDGGQTKSSTAPAASNVVNISGGTAADTSQS